VFASCNYGAQLQDVLAAVRRACPTVKHIFGCSVSGKGRGELNHVAVSRTRCSTAHVSKGVAVSTCDHHSSCHAAKLRVCLPRCTLVNTV
jgi:hypothetical protein